MKYTDKEIELLLAENRQLKEQLARSERGTEARNRLFDTFTEGSSDIAALVRGNSRKAVYVSHNVEEVLGIKPAVVMDDIRELGQDSGSDIGSHMNLAVGDTIKEEVYCMDRLSNVPRKYYRNVTRIGGSEEDMYMVIYVDATQSTENKMQKILSSGANGASNRLLAGMSHDLRTSLNSIIGNVLLQMKNPGDQVRVMDYAHRISMSCQSLLAVINQIIDMNYMENGDIELQESEFALGDIIEEVSGIIGSSAQRKHQHFDVRIKGLEYDLFIGDRMRILEILVNLLSNAVKYTQEGGKIALIVGGKRDTDPNFVNLSFEIRDNGIGMSSELQKRLFDNVSRVDGKIVPGMMGSGLGIGMTRKLVNIMGGTISVQSAPGLGSTLFVGLRLRAVSTNTDNFWSERGIHSVLVTCPDMNEAARISGLLENSGLQVDYASSGYGALQFLEKAEHSERRYHVVLIDRDLEDSPYGEIVKSIQKLPGELAPLVILMSDKDDHFLHPVKKEGIHGIIPKPFFFSTFRQFFEKQGTMEKTSESVGKTDNSNSLSGLRFLVAEDNSINADILKELLELEGARCEIAGNGRAALAMFQNSKPRYYDMLLMDIQMPVMNGYDATREIRKLTREDAHTVPILAMTADAMGSDMQKSIDCGMNAHISKPINIKLLNTTIRKLKK